MRRHAWLLALVALPLLAAQGIDESRMRVEVEKASTNLIALVEESLFRGEIAATNLFTLSLDEVPILDFVQFLERLTGVPFVYDEAELVGNVTVSLRDVEWEPALRVVLDSVDLTYVERGGRMIIMTKDRYEALPFVDKTYSITNVDFEWAVGHIVEKFRASDVTRIGDDKGAKTIRVRARLIEHNEIERCIAQLPSLYAHRLTFRKPLYWPGAIPADVLARRPSIPRVWDAEKEPQRMDAQTVFLQHVSAERVAERLHPFLDGRLQESLSVFPSANAVVIHALPDKMSQLFSICDYLDDERWYEPLDEEAPESP